MCRLFIGKKSAKKSSLPTFLLFWTNFKFFFASGCKTASHPPPFLHSSLWTNFNFAHTWVRDQTRKFRGSGRWINIAGGKLLLLALSRGVNVKDSYLGGRCNLNSSHSPATALWTPFISNCHGTTMIMILFTMISFCRTFSHTWEEDFQSTYHI